MKGIQEIPYEICYSHLSWFYKTNKRTCDSVRYGFKFAKDKYGHFIKEDPEKCNFMDQMIGDGHTLNIQCWDPDKPGKLCRPTLIAFVDQKTQVWLDGAVSKTECTATMKLATYRSLVAYGRLAGLSSPAMPRVIKLDNGKAFKNNALNGVMVALKSEMEGTFSMMGRYGLEHVSYAIPYNARSKVIERKFGELNEFEKMFATYVGNKLVAKPGYLQRNEKFLRQQHEALIEAQGGIPTLDEVYEYFKLWMIDSNQRASDGEYLQGKTHLQLIEEECAAIDFRSRKLPYKELFELLADRQYKTIGKRGVKMWGIDYYHEDLWNFTNVDNRDRYLVLGDPADKSRVFLHHLDGRYWMELQPTRGTGVSPIISVNGTEEDYAELSEGMRIQHHQEQMVKNQLSELYGIPVLNKKSLKNHQPKALGAGAKALSEHKAESNDYDEDEQHRYIMLDGKRIDIFKSNY